MLRNNGMLRWIVFCVTALTLTAMSTVLATRPADASTHHQAPAPAATRAATRAALSLGSALSPSGALRATHGSFNAKGYRMTLGAGGAPRFVAAPTGKGAVPAAAGDSSWSNSFGNPGMTGAQIYAVAVSGADVYVGGSFTDLTYESPAIPANNIAHWDGHGWRAMGTGTNTDSTGTVRAIAISRATVYIGGDFTTAGGHGAAHVASWNGTSWSALGTGVTKAAGGNFYLPTVDALAVSGTTLYVGGEFDLAGGATANSIAKWSGAAWSTLVGGVLTCVGCSSTEAGTVDALAVMGSTVYVGGHFDQAGPLLVSGVAAWNGSTWSAVGAASGVVDQSEPGTVYAFAVNGTTLYAGGSFDTIGGVAANSVAQWSGGAWHALGTGIVEYSIPGTVQALAYQGGKLYASGSMSDAGDDGQPNAAVWNGSTWTTIGAAGIDNEAYAMADSATGVVVAGMFANAGTISLNAIGTWTGTHWLPFGLGVSYGSNAGSIGGLGAAGASLFAGGNFQYAGSVPTPFVAHFNGTAWDSTNGGANQIVDAVLVSGTNVYIGGAFSQVGGVPATNIARWDGTAWHAMGSGTDSNVNALLMYDGQLWAGGAFTHAGGLSANKVARWSPATQKWSAVGGDATFDSDVNALAGVPAPNDHYVVVGGRFTYIAGAGSSVDANGLVMFDTSATITGPLAGYYLLGDSTNPGVAIAPCTFSPCSGTVNALLVDGTTAYVGGNFDDAGAIASRGFAAYNLAAADPATGWSSPGVVGGGNTATVNAIVKVGGSYYVGGDFTTAGSVSADYIASYTPSTSTWAPLGSGVSGPVAALTQSSAGLYVGGVFSGAGGNPSENLALWTATKPSASTTTLSSSVSSSTYGSPVSLTAHVSPAAASGVVTFSSGKTTVGAANLHAGTATLKSSVLPVGSDTVTASYPGDGLYGASTSGAVTINVAKATSSLTLTASAAAAAQGASVTFTARATPAAATGQVTFTSGSSTLGTANLSAGVAKITTTALLVGADLVSASYAGNSNVSGSTAGPVTVTVTKGPAAGTFVSLAPARVLDTRAAVGVATKTPVPAHGTVRLMVAGHGGVPVTGAAAVILNVTVTGTKASGYVTVFPDGTTRPTASNLNFVAGQTIPNLVAVKVGANGQVDLTNASTGTVNLIADVAGYYLGG